MIEPFDFNSSISSLSNNFSAANFDISKWVLIRQHHTHGDIDDREVTFLKRKKRRGGEEKKSIRDLLMDSF